jgi:AbrB family looped-hinge helix DNA binding protein
MTTVTVSAKYQIVIPRDVRASLGIKPGERLDAIPYRGHLVLVPVRPMRQARGFLRGIDADVLREPDRT